MYNSALSWMKNDRIGAIVLLIPEVLPRLECYILGIILSLPWASDLLVQHHIKPDVLTLVLWSATYECSLFHGEDWE